MSLCGQTIVNCNRCDQSFSDASALRIHLRTCEGRLTKYAELKLDELEKVVSKEIAALGEDWENNLAKTAKMSDQDFDDLLDFNGLHVASIRASTKRENMETIYWWFNCTREWRIRSRVFEKHSARVLEENEKLIEAIYRTCGIKRPGMSPQADFRVSLSARQRIGQEVLKEVRGE